MIASTSAPTQVKICGITQIEQAHEIAALGADYLGINFWPHSKRYHSWKDAKEWLPEAPASVKIIGVFVNPDVDELMTMHDSGLIHGFQLHGDESSAFCHELQRRGVPILKAFQVRNESTLNIIANYKIADILMDAYHPQERGGLGHTFPWELAREFQKRQPERALWLAGGLTADNVAEAVSGTRPAVVDVASGVEDKQPGIKNLEKVAAFIHAAKQAVVAT